MSGKKSYEEPNRERDRQSPGRSGEGSSESEKKPDRDFGGQRRHEESSSKKSENTPREPRS